MKKIILFNILSLIIHINLYAQNPIFMWAKGLSVKTNDITVDPDGNELITGTFSGTVDFNPGSGVFNMSTSSIGEIFVLKLDYNGDFLWALSFSSTMLSYGQSITTDSLGNIYLTGAFQGTVDFDPGPNISNLISTGGYDVFVSKLSSFGNFEWAKKWGDIGDDNGIRITIDNIGNVYSTGNFAGSVDFDPGISTSVLTSKNGSNDVFVSKLNNAGNYVWAKHWGSGFDDFGRGIAVDNAGNVITIGLFTNTINLNPGSGPQVNFTSKGGYDIFISKMDSLGNLDFGKSFGGPSDDYAECILVDKRKNIYCSGYFSSTVDFDPGAGINNFTSFGNKDIFNSKFDSLGNFIWAKQIGGTGGDFCYSSSLDTIGNLFSIGYFSGTADFDPNAGVTNLVSTNGTNDIYFLELDTLGNLVWARNIGGTSNDIGYSIYVDEAHNVYSTGTIVGTVDLDPDAGVFNLSSAGLSYSFIQKMGLATSVGVSESNLITSEINLYPNPTNNYLNINFNYEVENLKLKIFNSLGQTVFEKLNISTNAEYLDLSEFMTGVYIVEVTDNIRNSRKKFIKF